MKKWLAVLLLFVVKLRAQDDDDDLDNDVEEGEYVETDEIADEELEQTQEEPQISEFEGDDSIFDAEKGKFVSSSPL